MNATVQSGGRSPKTINGPSSTSNTKSGSDSLHNSTSSFPSQVKGKKRERTDQGSEPVKRERSSKMDDGDLGHSRTESFWRSEISKFTEKGALVDSEGVEKLVQLMLSEKNEKKIDLVGRSVLASVVAATEKVDCLSRFVQLRGLPVFDEWLQEVHKGKVGDGNTPKEGDKSIEEFLFVLLRALDKLPVNLHALQMCNIGKSVNHLRTHKNLEIQKKARGLVDTWKRRVEAEMDAKSGSNQPVQWAGRPRLQEVSHGGNRHSSASSDVSMKSSSGQLSTSKNTSFKVVHGETTAKPASAFPGSTKSSPSSLSVGNNVKEGQPRNIGLNGGSDSPQAVAGDEKSSSSSQSPNNSQSCSSEHAKTGGCSGKEDARSSTAISVGANKIIGSSSRHRKSMNGFTGPTSAAQKETGSSRNSSSHKNSGSEKLPQSALKAVDFKDVLTGSDEGDRSPGTVPDEDNSRSGDDSKKLVDIPKAASSSSGIGCKSGKLNEPSFSSINALVESCVKYSEANTLISVGDNVGMDLLASVAAGEMSKSDTASPSPSPQRNVTVPENSCMSNDLRMKSSPVDELVQDRDPSLDEHEKGATSLSNSPAKNTEDKPILMSQEQPAGELNGKLNSSSMDMQHVSEPCVESNVKSEETSVGTSLAFASASMVEKTSDRAEIGTCEEKPFGKLNASDLSDSKEDLCNSSQNEEKVNCSGVVGTKGVVRSSSLPSSEIDSDKKLMTPVKAEQESAEITQPGCTNVREVSQPSDSSNEMVHENATTMKGENNVKVEGDSQSPEFHKSQKECNFDSSKNDCIESLECNQGKEQHVASSVPSLKVTPTVVQESEQQSISKGSKLAGNEADEAECTSAAGDVSAPSSAVESGMEAKVEFDLNEGFSGDDGKLGGELNNLRNPECSTGVQLISPLPLPASSTSGGLPTSITVASAAKRPFIPPEDLLKNRGELGWKGSAATSAFRPAEPRKSLETAGSNSNFSLPDISGLKHGRPPLDIDLNVPDERIFEDMACQSTTQGSGSVPNLENNHSLLRDETLFSASVRNSGGLDLDLNRVDEPADLGNHLTSNGCRVDVHPVKSSGGILSVRRDFDLNDGPLDEVNREPSSFGQHTRNSVPPHSQLSVSSLQMNNTDMGNFTSWFPPVPAVTIQPMIPNRGEQPFPMAGPQRMLTPTAGTHFSPDVYRGSVLSSSPAVPFTSTPFQYPVFPFGTSFPLPSATFSSGSTTYVDSSVGNRLCFPAMTPQVLAPAGAVQSHYSRPFVVSLPDGNNCSAESSRKWGKQGLDLNAGPLGPEVEGRDETSSLSSRQFSVASSQSLTPDQSRIYQGAGGSVLKRKEPDGGWESYKQSSWQ